MSDIPNGLIAYGLMKRDLHKSGGPGTNLEKGAPNALEVKLMINCYKLLYSLDSLSNLDAARSHLRDRS